MCGIEAYVNEGWWKPRSQTPFTVGDLIEGSSTGGLRLRYEYG